MTSFFSVASTQLGSINKPHIIAPEIARLLAEDERRKGYQTTGREREQHFEQANKWTDQLGIFKVMKSGFPIGR
jgi:hypothetical protein